MVNANKAVQCHHSQPINTLSSVHKLILKEDDQETSRVCLSQLHNGDSVSNNNLTKGKSKERSLIVAGFPA